MDRDVQGGTARQRDVPAIYRKRQKQKIFVVHYKIGEKRMMDQDL